MADNYLEKKMEEFRSGKAPVKRQTASLESLLENITETRGDEVSFAAVMPAQLEAVIRAAKHLPEAAGFRFETDETASVIRILGPSSPRRYLLEAGQLILAIRLKAAELHLRCSVKLQPETTAPANPLIATLKLYK